MAGKGQQDTGETQGGRERQVRWEDRGREDRK